MIQCKRCDGKNAVRNSRNNGIQRYKCKECLFNFIEGDRRQKHQTKLKKAFCILMYSTGKVSMNTLSKCLGHSPSIIYRWIMGAMKTLLRLTISRGIHGMDFDEMCHFARSKNTHTESSKPWIVSINELLLGLQVIVMEQPLEYDSAKSHI